MTSTETNNDTSKMIDKKSERINLKYILEHRDKDGNLIEIIEEKSESFLRQFLQIIAVGIMHASHTIRDVTNVERAVDSWVFNPVTHSTVLRIHFLNAAAGFNVLHGIVAGTGTTPVTMTQHALITPILPGTGVGQLQYDVQTFVPVSTIGANTTFEIVRVLTNFSPGSITINEIGLYTRNMDWNFLIARDVISQILPINHTLTIRYIFRITL